MTTLHHLVSSWNRLLAAFWLTPFDTSFEGRLRDLPQIGQQVCKNNFGRHLDLPVIQ